MAEGENKLAGPDFEKGIDAELLPDGGMLAGHVGEEEMLLIRRGSEIFAVGAHCTHYHGPLADGLVVGDTVRCPWHHARFNLRTGEAIAAPALSPLTCWKVEQRDGKLFVREKQEGNRTQIIADSAEIRAGKNRHHRRRRGGICGSRHAATEGLPGQHCDVER